MLSDVDLLARLVAFDSVSSRSNQPIADFICDYVDSPQAEVHQLPAHEEGKVNILARTGQGNGGDGLILSGHMDTVPADEPEWETDPFRLTETETGYVGRGAADMKGFLALAVNLFRRRLHSPPERPLALLLTCDEELGLVGAGHFAQTWDDRIPLPRRAVIGEPTEMRAVRLHKGFLQVRISLFGTAAHSAYPHLGRSAIEPAARVIQAMIQLRKELETERHETSGYYPETPFVALNVGCIQGGSAVNVIPDRCTLDVGARLMPGMPGEEILPRIESVVEALELGPHEVSVIHEAASLKAPADSDLHIDLCRRLSQEGTEVVSYASDAGVIQKMGIDCVLFGPGSIEVAHKPNEIMPKDEFAAAVPILEDTVNRFCG